MLVSRKAPPKVRGQIRPGSAARQIKELARQLVREDAKLKLPLLDAAVAGVVLSFKPDHVEMRLQASRAWAQLEPILSNHLLSEKKLVPWAETMPDFPHEVLERIERRNASLSHLVSKIEHVNFEKDPDQAVADAGAALAVLAVQLDDLIESEELNLLPTVSRAMFAPTEPAAATETSGT